MDISVREKIYLHMDKDVYMEQLDLDLALISGQPVDVSSLTPVMGSFAIPFLARTGKLENIKTVLINGAQLDVSGLRALQWAMENNQNDVVEFLLGQKFYYSEIELFKISLLSDYWFERLSVRKLKKYKTLFLQKASHKLILKYAKHHLSVYNEGTLAGRNIWDLCTQPHLFLHHAIKYDRHDILSKWLTEKTAKLKLLPAIMEKGWTQYIHIFMDAHPDSKHDILIQACRSGNYIITYTIWLLIDNPHSMLDDDLLLAIAEGGSLTIYRWLKKYPNQFADYTTACRIAAQNGHIDLYNELKPLGDNKYKLMAEVLAGKEISDINTIDLYNDSLVNEIYYTAIQQKKENSALIIAPYLKVTDKHLEKACTLGSYRLVKFLLTKCNSLSALINYPHPFYIMQLPINFYIVMDAINNHCSLELLLYGLINIAFSDTQITQLMNSTLIHELPRHYLMIKSIYPISIPHEMELCLNIGSKEFMYYMMDRYNLSMNGINMVNLEPAGLDVINNMFVGSEISTHSRKRAYTEIDMLCDNFAKKINTNS